ncbi:MAG: hypothetical protein IEMM0008_1679 [bacterium]|nr:MAG: hypothetical protein IEMM0008_1679 [bacterium]
MVLYDDRIIKAIKKSKISTKILRTLHNAFLSLDLTKDYNLFDIREMKGYDVTYFRLRKGKYRAIFHMDDDNIYVDLIAKREEVYKLWELLQSD